MADRKGATLKIDVGPTQPEDLALPEADPEGHEIERLESVASDRSDERADLLHRERRDPAARDAGRSGEAGDIAGDEIGPLRMAEGPAQDAP